MEFLKGLFEQIAWYGYIFGIAMWLVLSFLIPFLIFRIRNEVISMNRKLSIIAKALAPQHPDLLPAAPVILPTNCIYCGAENTVSDENCANCGKPLP